MTHSPVMEPDPRRWPALFAAVTALFMTLLDLSIVIVALPSIGTSLGASASSLQWVVSGYALAFGVVPIIAGRLGDDRGRKTMLLFGIAAFVTTSLLAGLAPTAWVLIAARLVQGLAGGLLNPQVAGLVQQLFRGDERGRAFGAIGVAVGVATASGPVIGGLLIGIGGEQFGWRLCFLVNLPVGVASFLLCRRLLPDRLPTDRRHRTYLDLPGAALLGIGLLGVLFPFVQYDASHDLRLAALLVPAAAILAGFWWWERGPGARRGHPLIDVSLFKIRSYADGLGLALLYFIAYTGTPLVLSLFLQVGLGFSAVAAGLAATAFAVGTAVSAPIGGRLVSALGRRLLVGSLALFLLGVTGAAAVALLLAGRLPPLHLVLAMAVPLLVAGVGGGSVITPNQALSLADVDVRGGSTAGGMLQTAQRVGSAIGTAVIGAMFYARAAGAPSSGPARATAYGHAYAAALGISMIFGLAALTLAVREVRRSRQ